MPVAAAPDVVADVQAFLHGRPPEVIDSYGGPGSRRDVIEVVLVEKALAIGGFSGPIELVPLGSYSRVLSQLESGAVAVGGTSLWEADLTRLRGLLVSKPVIRSGEFEAGIFVSPRNEAALAVRDLAGLQHLKGVSNSQWSGDWLTLKGIPGLALEDVKGWLPKVRMVDFGRSDFLLAPFPSGTDLTLVVSDPEEPGRTYRLVPIPGIKLAIQGSRHFAASTAHPDGARAFAALAAGLALLEAKGEIHRAYVEGGEFNPLTAGWTVVNR